MDFSDEILKPWENFYVIVGGAAAALTGLVFVVITIVSDDADRPRSAEGTAAYTTPTVVHFGTALLIAMLLSAPWRELAYIAIPLALLGACGIVYVVRTAIRIRRMDGYDADAEDWSWHTLFPFVSYVSLTLGALGMLHMPGLAMFGVGFAAASLVFVGIHNAWDIVTYLAMRSPSEANDASTGPDADAESGKNA